MSGHIVMVSGIVAFDLIIFSIILFDKFIQTVETTVMQFLRPSMNNIVAMESVNNFNVPDT